jgi:hypothetical protein
MFDVLSGILLALSEVNRQTKESADLLFQNKLILYRILVQDPSKIEYCLFDQELLQALQFSKMLLSNNSVQIQLCVNFCVFLLHH